MTGLIAGSAAAPFPSVPAFVPAASGTVESHGQEQLSPSLASHQGLRTKAEMGVGSLQGTREKELRSWHPGPYLGRETGAVHTLSPPNQLL